MIDLIYDKNVTAKKKHRCILCGKQIVAGEKYRYSVAVDCGEFYHNHEHEKCADFASKHGYYDDMENGHHDECEFYEHIEFEFEVKK
jgi:hypothetical protein